MSTELEVFNPLKSEIAEFVAPVKTIKVIDFQSSADALEVAKRLKALEKEVEAKRKEIVGPLNDQVKRVNEYCKQITAPLYAASIHVSRELDTFAAEQERKRQEEQRRIEEERRRAEEELRAKQEAERAAALAAAPETDDEENMFGGEDAPGAVAEKHEVEAAVLRTEFQQKQWDADQQRIKNTRKSYEVEVVDIDQIPKEFLILTPNNQAIIAAHKAGVKIPGVKIVEKYSVAIGSKTRVPKAALGE